MAEPTAQEIKEYFDRQKKRYGSQGTLNDWMRDLYLQENLIQVKAPDKAGTKVERVKSGLAGLTVDQDVSVLSGTVRVHLTPRGAEKPAENLEAFTGGSFFVMEEEDPVRDPVTQDLRVFGYAAALGPIPDPKLWGDDEIKKLAEEMAEAEDSETFKEKDKAVEEFKRDNFPIIWQHIPADSFYPSFKRGRELSKCVWVKKMYRDDVEAEFGDVFTEKDRAEEVEVIEYVDQYWCKTVLNLSTPTEVRKWEHGMKVAGRRVCPVSFEEVDRLPANPQGWVWKGALFHVRGGLEAIDETLTDIRTNIREYTNSPIVVKHNAEARSQLEGWPVVATVGKGSQLNLLADEEVGRAGVPEMNPAAYNFLGLMKGFVDQVATNRPALQGQGPSGQSAVNLATSNAIGKAELKRPHRSLERFLTKSARLLFASVVALSEKFPDAEDTVTVRHRDAKNRSKEISVDPAGVKDWFHLVEVTVDLNLPVVQGANAQTASVAIQSGAVDPVTSREMFYNIENPLEIDERWAQWKLQQSAVTIINAMLIQRLTASAQAGQLPIEQLIEQSYSTTQAAQEALMMALQADGVELNIGGGVPSPGRSLNNQAEAGRVSQMSELAGTQQGLE